MIINPGYLSNSDLLKAIENWIDAKEDSQKWKDRYDTSIGQTELELAAGFMAYIAYQAIVGRREIPLSTCQNYSSAIGAAWDLGYSTFRGKNLEVSLKCLFNASGSFVAGEVIGIFADVDIVSKEDQVFNAGDVKDIPVIIGNRRVTSQTITSDAMKIFTFFTTGISEQIHLYLNGTEIPFSSVGLDMSSDKWIIKTNTYESVDCIYSQAGEYKYTDGDVLSIVYSELNPITSDSFSPSQCELDHVEAILDYSIISEHLNKEDIERVRVAAPIQRDVQHVVRARQDFYKLLVTENAKVISGNYKDITAGIVAITYQLKSGGILPEEEVQEAILNITDSCRPGGTATAQLYHPQYYDIPITISIWKEPDENLPEGFESIIDNILTTKSGLIGKYVDPKEIERMITYYKSVQIARVSFDIKSWKPNTFYTYYDIIDTSDFGVEYGWVFSGVVNLSGEENPFPTEADDGTEVYDGNIIWRKISNNNVIPTILTWIPLTEFKFGNFILNNGKDIWQVVGFIEKTSENNPFPNSSEAVPEEGVIDNEVLHWIETEDEANEVWRPSKYYKVGTVLNSRGRNYKLDKYVYKSSGYTDFGETTLDTVIDGRIKWKLRLSEYQKIYLEWNHAANLVKTMTLQ